MIRTRVATSGIILATALSCYLADLKAYTYKGEIGAWASGTNAPFLINLGAASGSLSDGNSTWDTAALPALTSWNGVLGRFQMIGSVNPAVAGSWGNGINEITWSGTAFGSSWGKYTLAVTQFRSSGANVVESDVLFNPNQSWDSYRGSLRFGSNGFAIGDIRRVLLHELGHALGLGHPDQAGQNTDAVMNSITSDRDALSADDIAGGQSLYGAPSTNPTPTPSPTATPIPTATPDPTATPVPTATPDATPALSVSAAPTVIMEGSSATFTITTSMVSATPITVNYSMGGNAAITTYYTLDGTVGQVTIPAGSTSATVTLVAPSNPKKKGSETATMNLTGTSAFGLASSSASVTIRNVKKVAASPLTLPSNDPENITGDSPANENYDPRSAILSR